MVDRLLTVQCTVLITYLTVYSVHCTLYTNLGAAALLKKELAGVVEYEEREGSVKGRGAINHLVTFPLGRLRQVRR